MNWLVAVEAAQGAPEAPSLLLAGLRNPEALVLLDLPKWDMCLRQARLAGVLASLQGRLANCHLLERLPHVVRDHLRAARAIADAQQRSLRWELRCIRLALAGVCDDFIVLKGSAYALAELPPSLGRLQSDVDILVPLERIGAVEHALLTNGWQGVKLEEYDQFYYRKWSHELPPLVHKERGTTIDVHHSILPIMGRLHPDSRRLLAASKRIDGTSYWRLADVDMVLHAAAHLFQDGDGSQCLRGLLDLDGLMRAFSGGSRFWEHLQARAPEMELQRPMYYALRYCDRYLGTPFPPEVLRYSATWAPPAPLLYCTDRLIHTVLHEDPRHPRHGSASRALLYLRSHWLRMPPMLLLRHLSHQLSRRFTTKSPGAERPG